MRYTTKTEYGVVCLVFMAKNYTKSRVISVHDLVVSEEMSVAYIEKIFQSLRASGIVISHQGKNGGYSLSRDPSQITLKEIIEALEGSTFEVFCEPDIRKGIVCTHISLCGVGPVWEKTKELLDSHYSQITLESLAKHEENVRATIGG